MHLLSREEMYWCDRYTINELGIPAKNLMENAGKHSAEFIRDNLLEINGKILIFCGSGNNGGDGFVVGRYLHLWGFEVQIVLTGKEEKMTEETLSNKKACDSLGISIYTANDYYKWQNLNIALGEFDVIADALMGVGLKGKLKGWLVDLIAEINQKSQLTIAIDIASGIDANTGTAEGAVEARYTLTMAAIKYGMLLEAGKTFSGKIIVIDIGMPESVINQITPSVFLINQQDIKLPERKPHYHKGNYGRIAIIAGSPGFSGAAIMASRAALRSGAGLITLFHPQNMGLIFETQLLEVMTRSFPDSPENIINELQPYDAVLFGPGMGKGDSAKKILETLINYWNRPLVIDADGLNLLSEDKIFLDKLADKPVLLTPHIGEFSRLCGYGTQEILTNRMEILMAFCRKYKVNVLLKSSSSILCDQTRHYLITRGNDGLSTGGSGDVLSGIIIGMIGQGLSVDQAGITGSWLLGETAEKLTAVRKTNSIIPSDIIENLFMI